MSTDYPDEESRSQSLSDIPQSGQLLEPADQSAVTSASVRDQATGPQGHPLAAILRSLAVQVDHLAGPDVGGQLDERLAVLQQDTVWVGEVLRAWQAAARLKPGERAPHLMPIDLQRLVREQTEVATGPASLKGISLEFDPQSQSEVMGELGMCERMVKAMLSAALLVCRPNAILGVTLAEAEGSVACTLAGEAEGMASHDDSGPALEHGQWAELVELLRPLTEAQAGTLAYENPSGETFELAFSLPAARASDAPAEGTVLIVDDDPDGAFLLEQVLLKSGFHVRIAGNGLEGLSLARQEGIAVILLDVMLPGLDGFEVCHRLREDPATAKTPIVMISAKSRAEDREMGLQVGANAYMTKPLGMNDVVQTVTRFMTENEEGSHDR